MPVDGGDVCAFLLKCYFKFAIGHDSRSDGDMFIVPLQLVLLIDLICLFDTKSQGGNDQYLTKSSWLLDHSNVLVDDTFLLNSKVVPLVLPLLEGLYLLLVFLLALLLCLTLDLLGRQHLVVVLDTLNGHVVVGHLDVFVDEVDGVGLAQDHVIRLDVEVLDCLLREVVYLGWWLATLGNAAVTVLVVTSTPRALQWIYHGYMAQVDEASGLPHQLDLVKLKLVLNSKVNFLLNLILRSSLRRSGRWLGPPLSKRFIYDFVSDELKLPDRLDLLSRIRLVLWILLFISGVLELVEIYGLLLPPRLHLVPICPVISMLQSRVVCWYILRHFSWLSLELAVEVLVLRHQLFELLELVLLADVAHWRLTWPLYVILELSLEVPLRQVIIHCFASWVEVLLVGGAFLLELGD